MKCRICATPTDPHGQATLLGKYTVQYFRCRACGFVQTEAPYWIEEAYQTTITATDLGSVNRGFVMAFRARALILTCLNPRGRFVDYGAGYGIFVRRMRDMGFDFRYYDKYGGNVHASGFEAPVPEREGEYELVTAFEVFEHLVDPPESMREMRRFSSSILLSTELLPTPAPRPDDWWYYAPHHGQHVSFYTVRSLRCLAEQFKVRFVTDGDSLHLFTARRVPAALFRLLMKPGAGRMAGALLSRLLRVESLLPKDMWRLTQKRRAAATSIPPDAGGG